jgi:hypothetical protein
MVDQHTNPGATFEKAPGKLGPAWHEDRFQPIGKRMPVALKTNSRPQVSQRNVPSLSPRRMTVLVRDANSRPNEAGIIGDSTFVSNPTMSGMGVDDPAAAIVAAAPKPSTILMIVGAVAALYYLGFKR